MERWEKVESVFHAALQRPEEERDSWAREVCSDDPALYRDVASLLANYPGSTSCGQWAPAATARSVAEPMPLEPGQLLGPYRVIERLGGGGMGEVYLAQDPQLNRRVALKVLPLRLADDAVARQRLRREAQAAAALDHPFICKIFEVAEESGILFFVMEYVRGETLSSRLRAGRMPLQEGLRVAGEIAEAIGEAHASGVVHRDLKPANIMLSAQGHIKVMDFGLAKNIGTAELDKTRISDAESLTADGLLLGTPDYVSPEQAIGGAVDHRSDLFSFGMILCELLTGRHPFRRSSSMETITAILRDPPNLTVGDVPPGLIILMRRLLAKSPEERYASMGDVHADMVRLASTPLPEPKQAAGPRVSLIGREQERAELLRLLDAALGGRGSLVLIGGEPGIGKTHLARAIRADAAGRGCFAVSGHCYEMEGAPPYVPFIEMLEYGARAFPRETFRYALGDAAPEIARLMPELRRIYTDIPPPIELPPEQRRRFMFNAYREFVERAATVTPLIAVFEDLHWADEPTLLLLQHLAQTVASQPVLMIGTYRDLEVDATSPFARTLETLVKEKLAMRIPLRPLRVSDVEALLRALSGTTPPTSIARFVFAETEGNPFFVEEVFRYLAEQGKLFDERGAWRTGLRPDQLRVPESVRLVIGRRLERLGGEARRILTTAAIVGRSFSLRVLEHLESARPDAALDAVEEAERAHLVEAESQGRETRYRFVHELIRQMLVEALSLPRRQRMHARIADSIERIYTANIDAHAPALAYHLYQAGIASDAEKACTWLTRAAQQANAAAAFEDALAHLDTALSLIEGEQSTRVAELYAERATVLRSLARMEDAMAAFERALALFEANAEAERFAETCIPLAGILLWTVRPDEAREICRRGLELLGEIMSPIRIFLMYGMAQGAVLANDIDSGIAIFNELQQIPVPPDPAAMRLAARLQVYLRFGFAQVKLAYEEARSAQQLCASAGDAWGQADVVWFQAVAAWESGRIQEAVSIANKTIPLAERVGHWGASFYCKWILYEARLVAGDLECATEFSRVLDEYDRLHFVPWGFVSKVGVANAARLRGRVQEAVEWCERANIPQRNHLGGLAHAALALTFAQAGDSRLSQALKEALQFMPQAGRPAPEGRWYVLNHMIEALAAAGQVDDAAAFHPVAEDMIAAGYVLIATCAALPRTTAGIAAGCAGNWTRAEEHHQTAIHLSDTMPHKIAQPIARYWYADMLRMRDEPRDRTRARALLNEALLMCETLGLPLYGRQASERLQMLSI